MKLYHSTNEASLSWVTESQSQNRDLWFTLSPPAIPSCFMAFSVIPILLWNFPQFFIRPLQENSLFPISCSHVDFLPAWSSIIVLELMFYLFACDCTVCTNLAFTRSFWLDGLPLPTTPSTKRARAGQLNNKRKLKGGSLLQRQIDGSWNVTP